MTRDVIAAHASAISAVSPAKGSSADAIVPLTVLTPAYYSDEDSLMHGFEDFRHFLGLETRDGRPPREANTARERMIDQVRVQQAQQADRNPRAHRPSVSDEQL